MREIHLRLQTQLGSIDTSTLLNRFYHTAHGHKRSGIQHVLSNRRDPAGPGVRPSTVEGGNERANTLFGTVDREGVGNEEGANLLLLPPLWSALLASSGTPY